MVRCEVTDRYSQVDLSLQFAADELMKLRTDLKSHGERLVTRKATVCDIELELWAKESPKNDRPLYPPRLIKTIILNNPFSDITPRITVKENEVVTDSSKTKTAAEDDEESAILSNKFSGKSKSAHDHLTDPKLSSQPAVEPPGLANKKRKEDHSSDWESDDEVET
ncbi:Peptidyl-prolyl isomerase cwc27 [Eufriesea mexicana]|uniref:Peptidyl-prolyl isomerase cwc27 n=1 Tax=Eufriesea mexicana TaxID=516756 RepID=A0A310SQQ7_9HYME|nr:Peptidyl-prolyl isomerase cwc27 [Eufriesea mexicana]